MFSVKEKQLIAKAVEDVLLSLDHPEMPKEHPRFVLVACGKEDWSWAKIEPNWTYDSGEKEMGVNPWNEVARDVMKRRKANEKIIMETD